MQLNVRELEQLVAIRCNGLQNELAELKEKYSANVELFKVLERNYTERGIALEAATKRQPLSEAARAAIDSAIAGYQDDRYRFSKLSGLPDTHPAIIRIDGKLAGLRAALNPTNGPSTGQTTGHSDGSK
jgi:hypothetical protein